MTTFIEEIYEQVTAIRYISTDDFSCEYLDKNPSYYRSLKSRHMEPSTSVLLTLMEHLGKQATVMRAGRSHQMLQQVAERYEALGVKVGKEITRRSFREKETSKWVRETLVRIVNSISDERNPDRDDSRFSAPAIIIC